MTDVIVVTPAQEAALVIIMTTEIAAISQSLMTPKARIIMPSFATALGLVLAQDPALTV